MPGGGQRQRKGDTVDYDYEGPARRGTRKTGPSSSQQTQTSTWDGYRRMTGLDSGTNHDLAYGYDDLSRRTFKQRDAQEIRCQSNTRR